MAVLADGTYLSVVMDSAVRGARREEILTAARTGHDLTALPAALDDNGRARARLVRVIEYTVPDRDGGGTGELIVLLTTITNPTGHGGAHADELAARLPRALGGRNRQRPVENPPAWPRCGAALPTA